MTSRAHGQHLTNEGRLEQGLWAAEALVANSDDLPVRQLVALLQGGRRGRRGHLILKIQGHIAQLLLDVSHNFSLSWRVYKWQSGYWALHERLYQVLSRKLLEYFEPSLRKRTELLKRESRLFFMLGYMSHPSKRLDSQEEPKGYSSCSVIVSTIPSLLLGLRGHIMG